MKKLSEYRNEEALDLLADIIEPCVIVFGDPDFIQAAKSKDVTGTIKFLLKNHQKSVIQILATLEGVPVDEYECNLATLPVTLLQIVNDSDLMDFFKSQGQELVQTSSGSAMVSTEDQGIQGDLQST